MSRPHHLHAEHHQSDRLGTGEPAPRLSWRLPDDAGSARQEAYRLEVRRDGAAEVSEVASAEQVLVPWPSAPLRSRERVEVRVQVRLDGAWTAWSEPSTVEVGLLDPADWSAVFVGGSWPEDQDTDRRPSRVRRTFVLEQDHARARAYVTAHGLVELEVNGQRVGTEELTPGWTSYQHRLRYATFDIGRYLRPGENTVGAWLGDGWWRGRIGFEGGTRNVYGDDLSALVQLEVDHVDGSRTVIASDAGWEAEPSPITTSSLYDGEHFDARLDDGPWSVPGASADGWTPVAVHGPSTVPLVAPSGPAVRAVEELRPVTITDRGDGRYVLDFGQNHSGRLRVTTTGSRGQRITLRHAEVLQDGELYTRTLRDAASTDVWVLSGAPTETWEPRFTVHGYRYAEVSGWTGPLTEDDVVSRVLHTDMQRSGWFACSDERIERLHENVLWSLRSNFVDIPTDCPQRDERLGWTGDIQVFTSTAAFLYDVSGLLSSWLVDVAAEQDELDFVPFYVPYLPLGSWQHQPRDPSSVWGDVAVLTPAELFRSTGDAGLLRRQYTSGRRFVDQYEAAAGDDLSLADTFQLGDWLDPSAPPEDPFAATTRRALVAEAYFAYSARRLSEVAEVIGESVDAARLRGLGDRVAAAFAERYVRPDGTMVDDTQTAYSLALVFDLFPTPETARRGGDRLAELVRAAGGTIATGFAGTNLVSDALSGSGHLDEAYLLLATEENPSWLYPVSMGATTIWERWDSMLPDGTVNPGDMTSFNHYALGAVASWLHRVVAGLAPSSPGYRTIRFAPRPGGELRSASARHVTPYGVAAIAWRIKGRRMHVSLTVPPGTTATLSLPGHDDRPVPAGRHEVVVETS